MAALGSLQKREGTISPARAIVGFVKKVLSEFIKPDRGLLRQSTMILLICAMIDLFPGYFLGTFERYLILVPGLLILLPPTVGLRGNTFGALAARLSSRLHLGTIEPRFRRNSELKQQMMASGIQLMVLSSLIPFAGTLMALIAGVEIAKFHELLLISLLGGILSGILMFAISLSITFISFRKGWDPDNVSAPIIASTGDVLTIPIFFLAAWITVSLSSPVAATAAYTSLVLLIIVSAVTMIVIRGEYRSIIKNALPIALGAIILSSISGLILENNFSSMFQGTVFLLLIPAFNGQGGSIGSILGSRITSAGYLGTHRLTLKPNTLSVSTTSTLWLISMVVFSAMAVGGFFLGSSAGVEIPFFPVLLLTMLTGATLISIISSASAYYLAYLSFKIGLDPDNVVIPLLTASMDIAGSGSLLIVIVIMGWIF
ncbi:MAG: magnesium transporter [Thermoplasmatota archaeon]